MICDWNRAAFDNNQNGLPYELCNYLPLFAAVKTVPSSLTENG
jgi:hypothetical protein